MGVKTWARSFDLSLSPSGSELAFFEKLERYTTASFRPLIPSGSGATRHPQTICASAQTSIPARGTYHDRDHRRALQFVFSGKSPREVTGNLGADPVNTFELFLDLSAVRFLILKLAVSPRREIFGGQRQDLFAVGGSSLRRGGA
jgi:hypothetical protein